MAPPLLPLSPAAGEAGRKFSMKQRGHAARWLTRGAQGHWCWLEKANTIFWLSNRFRSKFGRVKHPDRSKYSPFIPENKAGPIFSRKSLKKTLQTRPFLLALKWIYLQCHFENKYKSLSYVWVQWSHALLFNDFFIQRHITKALVAQCLFWE